MKVSIVIPAYNAEKTIGQAVGAALSQGCPDCEVIVVDDGSTDGTQDAVKRYPFAKYVRQDNAGPASARNAGWRASVGEVIMFTDSDCVPQPGWARALAAGFTEDTVGAVTGSYDIANPDDLLPMLIHEEIKDRHAGYKDTVKFFGSYNVALRRSVLEETGGFDETYRRASGEDNDLSYRVTKRGYKIAFAAGSLVSHYHTSRLWKYLKEQYTHGYWRMKLYKAHPDMAGGDDYTRIKDVVEPPLALTSLGSVLLLPFTPLLLAAAVLLLALIQVPAAVRIAARRRDASGLLLAPVTFFRGYARGMGMLAGAVRFFIIEGSR